MRATLLHPWKLALFAGLSVTDFLLTWGLLQPAGAWVYEWNPVAAWWLARYDWAGLLGFKLATVLLVGGLAAVIGRHRPRTAGRVLTFACSAVAAAVIYSGYLSWAVAAQPGGLTAEDAPLAEKSRLLERKIAQAHTYQRLLYRLGEDLITRRCTPAEAAAQLARTERGQDPEWLDLLRQRYPGRSDRACLAANVCDHVVISLRDNQPAAERMARRLRADMRRCYRDGSFRVSHPTAESPARPSQLSQRGDPLAVGLRQRT